LSEQTEQDRKREARRRMLGPDRPEHGGGYRAPKSDWIPDAGCCSFELLGALSAFVGLLVTAYSLLP
jgi:hypothetical protein